jgi:hypothetical protein
VPLVTGTLVSSAMVHPPFAYEIEWEGQSKTQWVRLAMKMRIPEPVWELTLLAGLACLGLGLAWSQEDMLFATIFATEAGLAAVEAFYLSP